MKDEPTLDAAGPITVIVLLTVILVIAFGITLEANLGWGDSEPASLPAVASVPPADAH
ncbi:MAG: hypothetical protein HKP30_14815 [Myxococcales bacterium]|nr:hypothetical protein [Myxococcales bacterium]